MVSSDFSKVTYLGEWGPLWPHLFAARSRAAKKNSEMRPEVGPQPHMRPEVGPQFESQYAARSMAAFHDAARLRAAKFKIFLIFLIYAARSPAATENAAELRAALLARILRPDFGPHF